MITKEQAFGMYIGHKVQYTSSTGFVYNCRLDTYFLYEQFKMFDCKLILRPFKSMEDNEMSRFNSYYKTEVDTQKHYKLNPNSIKYLISIGIDVFNLKERGWAVYESEVEK